MSDPPLRLSRMKDLLAKEVEHLGFLRLWNQATVVVYYGRKAYFSILMLMHIKKDLDKLFLVICGTAKRL